MKNYNFFFFFLFFFRLQIAAFAGALHFQLIFGKRRGYIGIFRQYFFSEGIYKPLQARAQTENIQLIMSTVCTVK